MAEIARTETRKRPDNHPAVESAAWRYDVYDPRLKWVLPAAKRFCSAIINRESPQFWFSLLGPSGVGKTHVMRQVVALLREEARQGRWKIQTGTGHRSPEIAHIVPSRDLDTFSAAREYARFYFVYIEDIGSGQFGDKGAGAVTKARVTELLQLRSGKWTALCANMLRDEIAEQLDPRIASRLKRDGGIMIEIPAGVPDYWDKNNNHQKN